MKLSKDTLESEIKDAIVSRLSPSYDLSDKAQRRITKSAGKLADRLSEIFEKKERKAARKAAEMKDDPESSENTNITEAEDDLN